MPELFDDPEAVLIDEDDLRWGMAVPADWKHRHQNGMTAEQWDLFIRIGKRLGRERNRKGVCC